MFSAIFSTFKKKNTLEESVLQIQNGNIELRNELLRNYKPFIKKSVSSVCKRYIYESDDEFSIGLIAFNEAIDKYSPERGASLLSFADTIIKRRVIDYLRVHIRKNQQYSLVYQRDSEDDNEQNNYEVDQSVEQYRNNLDTEKRREEILKFRSLLQTFGIPLETLVKQSPKHADARENAILIAKKVVDDEELMNFLFEKKKLPVKRLEEMVHVSRKTIERNRNYIVAMAIVLSGDYLYLQDYLKGVLAQ